MYSMDVQFHIMYEVKNGYFNVTKRYYNFIYMHRRCRLITINSDDRKVYINLSPLATISSGFTRA